MRRLLASFQSFQSFPSFLVGLALVAVALLACGGQTTSPGSPSPDGGGAIADAPGDDGGPALHTGILVVVQGFDGCLPQRLATDAQGEVACTIYELPPGGATCDASLGLWTVSGSIAARLQGAAHAPPSQAVCALAQLPDSDFVAGSCETSAAPGWCYVSGAAAGQCPQAIRFSPGGVPSSGTVVVLGC